MEGLASLRTKLNGQEHSLAWINRNEAQALKDMGGSGKPGPMGIPAFYADETEDDDTSWSDEADFDPGPSGPASPGGTGPGGPGVDPNANINVGPGSGPGPAYDPNKGVDVQAQEELYDLYQFDVLGRDEVEGLLGFSLDDPYQGYRDMHDYMTVQDIQRQANELGADVTVGFDPISGVPTYRGTDALGFGLGQIGQGVAGLGGLFRDAYMGMTGLTPLGLIRDTLMGSTKTLGGRMRSGIFDREAPVIDPKGYAGLGLQGFVMGDPYSKADFFSKASKDLGISDAIDSIKDTFGSAVAQLVEEATEGMTEQEFNDYIDKTFGDNQYQGMFE